MPIADETRPASYPSPPAAPPSPAPTSSDAGTLTKNRTYLNGAIAAQAYLRRTRAAMRTQANADRACCVRSFNTSPHMRSRRLLSKALWMRLMRTYRCRSGAAMSIRRRGMC
jgi:hypothetical protein